MNASPDSSLRPRPLRLAVIVLISLLFFSLFYSLGVWQIHRRAWKLDLIAKVHSRVHQPAVRAPRRPQWRAVNAAADEYLHVYASGTFLYDKQTLVQAVTDFGSGYWVLTPLRRDDGELVMVNRGFVLPEWRKQASPEQASGPVKVVGLMRMDEPKGAFLRHNEPAIDFWYTRDLQGIAAKRGLGAVAPYFIDMQGGPGVPPDPKTVPVPGLTRVHFPNNHLSYLLTWFALAAMTLVGGGLLWRDEWRRGKPAPLKK
ncbi:SURF1 family protein [Bordetella sp. FB-8]|uniref:SURF1 family protein n=1 Tax=Bordetella sp. FB-8 TaxID=1159870 RepID=UPI000372D2DF|nr:SURF1 family protein [Bordetella sp. FB-8]